MTKRITTIVIAAVTATALLAACGDDDKKSSDGGSSDTAAGGDTTAAAGGETDAYCAQLESFELTTDSLDSSATAEEVRAAFETVEPMLTTLKSNAPADIQADVTLLSDPLAQLIALYRQYDWDFDAATTDPEFGPLNFMLANPDTDAAEARINAWALDTCGLDMAD